MDTYDIQNTLNYTQIKNVRKTNQNTNGKIDLLNAVYKRNL